jgi:regulator of protease activity HflC (stomatin/prohibitin superfamily)
MDRFELALIIIFGLFLFILSMNIKIVPVKRVLVIERLGRFHKLIDQPGIYFLIPLLDRVYQSVSLEEEKHTFKFQDEEDTICISYLYKVCDVKLFVYGEFDTLSKIDELIKEVYTSDTTHQLIDNDRTIAFALERGVNLRDITKYN